MKYFFLAFLFLSACARPDYIDPKTVQKNQGADSACSIELVNSNLCASIAWTMGPQTPAESEFILKVWDKTSGSENGPFVDPANTLSVVLWMPSMGHGSSPVTIEKIETGTYRVRRVYFIMPGDWEVRFFLKNGATTLDQATVSLVL
ncbi:FixH family protein [Bdellovibrio sp. SKB1291214]|uniref:FixH family protein n=1 Tax=Bdellovibrio sp. SKB1291214 TaxID=1732569 RepID=UPI000B51E2D8|nr:FixH family protein [Bdellovibrio sp. SKB1291214]UYL07776.1 FixH family protein [Bdellovibrio sp. SKB1291214]